MIRKYLGLAVLLTFSLSLTAAFGAVEKKEKTQFKMGGFAGKLMGMFGGKAAKEGIISTVAVVGDKKLTRTDDTGEIIDLAEEKVFRVDWKKKTYTVMTFDELRKQMQDAAKSMQEASGEKPKEESDQPKKEYEVDFELKETGQTKNINGFDTREILMVLTTREKGKTLEEGGGMVMTSNIWMTKEIEGTKEIADFDRRYAEKIFGGEFGANAGMVAAMAAMYPGLKESMSKFEAEKVNMDGTPVLTTMKIESVVSKEQMQSAKEQGGSEESESSGLVGGFMKKFGKKKQQPEEAAAAPGRTTVMTTTNELMSMTGGVGADVVTLPADFKLKK